jgi:hypothetical protein
VTAADASATETLPEPDAPSGTPSLQLGADELASAAAQSFDFRFEGVDIGREDVTGNRTEGFSLTTGAQRDLAVERLDDAISEVTIGREDVTNTAAETGLATGPEFGLTASAEDRVAIERLDERVPEVDIGREDVVFETGDDGSRRVVFERGGGA